MDFSIKYDLKKYRNIVKKQEALLAPYAVKDTGSKKRNNKVNEDGNRNLFQQDRDRILYCSSFRRLSEKTQVFIYNRNSMHRTRLTHSLEVSQISRSIAQMLEVNSDLCEAIAMAHDLGHAPFGHAGEHTLQGIMKNDGGFEHNKQSLRIVELLEHKFIGHRGLNLTFATREGIIKHVSTYDSPALDKRFKKRNTTIEAEIVSIADRISYNTHDLEDSFREGLLELKDIEKKVPFLKFLGKKVTAKYGKLPIGDYFNRLKGQLIGTLVLDTIDNSRKNINRLEIETFNDVISNKRKENIVWLSPELDEQMKMIELYLYKNIYSSPLVVKMNDKAEYLISSVFQRYIKNPAILKKSFVDVYSDDEKNNMKRIICDYISGMTDRFLIEEYQNLYDPMKRIFV